MRQFFKFMLASMLGFFVSFVLVVFLVMLIISGIIASSTQEKAVIVSPNSVLYIKLDYPITERTSSNPFKGFSFSGFSFGQEPGLNDILANIKKAGEDPSIKGIYLELSAIPAGVATIEEIRAALDRFRKSGKFIVAYGEAISQGAYYLATAADNLCLYPSGELDFKGLKAEIMFYKGAFEKLEIEPEIIRHGKFKSAVEPFITDKMSPENRQQTSVFLSSMWNVMLENISLSRHIPVPELQRIADGMLAESATEALKYKMVDRLLYKDELYSLIRKKLNIAETAKINFINLRKYNRAVTARADKKPFANDKIAVIYAAGDIGGSSSDESINPDKVSEAIRKARLDNKIKAIVLRVNSPGGSALASDIIWREVVLAKRVKPVVASFGDYAASGGYYIACGATKIVSQPNTITGSIGVFGMQFNAQKLLNNKLGITFDTVKTGRMADFGSMSRPLTMAEKELLQGYVERIYGDFVGKVAEGRHLSKTFVDSIGQGRVWSAADGKRLGLIDEFGGLDKAVQMAAELAHTTNYRLTELPEQKEPLQKLIDEFSEEVKARVVGKEMHDSYKYYVHLQHVIDARGIQARLPFEIEIY